MMYRLIQLCFICTIFVLQFDTQGAIAQEVVSTFPKSLQLYPRDVTNNEAIVPISGTIDADTYTQITIEVFREDELWFNVIQPISDVQSTYNHEVTIRAELVEYSFYLFGITHNDERILLKTATRVVAGDAFLVSGQSNAIATGTPGVDEQRLNEHPFSRTFSTPNPDLALSEHIYWEEARSRGTAEFTGVGVWAGRMCWQLIETMSVPCAVINGAFPGVDSAYFARNDEQPLDLETNYGRTLWRSQNAGLHGKFRAIIWYQGEDDAWQPLIHKNQMEALRSDWAEDYPNIEHTYLMQIRYGCGFNFADSAIFEVQRQFKAWENTSILSTNGISDYDGCHYYAPGYEKLGNHLYRMVARDLYGAIVKNVDSPDILEVKQATLSEIVVTLDMPRGDTLIYDTGFHVDFTISERGTDFIPFYGVADSNVITLTLARPITLIDATLSYVGGETDIRFGHNLAFTDWVTNRNGVGILNFTNKPIESLAVPTGSVSEGFNDTADHGEPEPGPIPLAISYHAVNVMRTKHPLNWMMLIVGMLISVTVTFNQRTKQPYAS